MDFCESATGDGCARSFPNKSAPGLCAKCTKLASLTEGSVEYDRWKSFEQCESCGIAWKNPNSPKCGRCDNMKAPVVEPDVQGLARTVVDTTRAAQSAMDLRLTKQPSIGPNHQHHADGYDKLNAQALNMGGVGLNIYGIKDQWSSFILHLVVVPNIRLATTIGHVHLDCVEKHKLIPITFVTNIGSETGIICANQTGLRAVYTPELDIEQFPPILQIRSVHNTPIKGLWHWFLQTFGNNIKDTIRGGFDAGIYNPNNTAHPNLFYWLWPKILQNQLDKYAEYWNNHKIRSQAGKSGMSGSTPRHGFTVPALPAEDCRIVVDQIVIDALRAQTPVSREESMRWVDDLFEVAATNAYTAIGVPSLDNLLSGWEIFSSMASVLSVTYNS